MKTLNDISELIRQMFYSYEKKDRAMCERLLSENFTFTSPHDDRIDRSAYFERCWPNSDKFRAVHIDKIFAQGNEAFVRYRADLMDGASFTNTEFITAEGGRIKSVEVYFGRSL